MKIAIRAAVAAAMMTAGSVMMQSAIAQDDDRSLRAAYTLYVEAAEAGDDIAMADYAEKAYRRGRESLPEGDVQIGYLAANYGEMLLYRDRTDEALAIFRECVDILSAYQPETDLDTANCWAEIGWIHDARGEQEKLIEAFTAVVALIDAASADRDAAALLADAHLVIGMRIIPYYAPYLSGMEDTTQMYRIAQEHGVNALSLLGRLGYEQTERAANAHQLVAHWHYVREESDYIAANRHYKAAYEILRALHGSEDERTLRSYGMHRRLVNTYELLPAPRRRLGNRCVWLSPDGTRVRTCDLETEPPRYPDEVISEGEPGSAAAVHVLYDVNEKGRTENIRIIFSVGSPLFGHEVTRMIERWRYQPPKTEEGQPTRLDDVSTIQSFLLVR